MNSKNAGIVGVLFVSAVVIAAMVVVANRKRDHLGAPGQSVQAVASLPPASVEPLPPAAVPGRQTQTIVQPQNKPAEPPVIEKSQQGETQLPQAKSQGGKPAKSKPPIQDPTARVALSLVGADPDAEEYWYSAINDASLSPHERKDLIEDLNEDGLSNPKHPGPQDMPLIWSRIQLIEDLAPYAMDQVNAEAFAEAYKDLINLAGGQPAQ